LKKRNKKLLDIGGLTVLALAGCSGAPTGLLDPMPAHLDATYRKVLVVGLGADDSSRQALEAGFAARLPGAVAAYSVIAGPQPDAAAIKAAAARVGADAILAVRLLAVHQHSDGLPGYVHALPASATPVGFGAFYQSCLSPDPQHYEAASLEVDLWAVRTDSLAWSALTPVFTPTDASAVTANASLATGEALAPATRR
jgi:hypothetical protein